MFKPPVTLFTYVLSYPVMLSDYIYLAHNVRNGSKWIDMVLLSVISWRSLSSL